MAKGDSNNRPSVDAMLGSLRTALADAGIDELDLRNGECVVRKCKLMQRVFPCVRFGLESWEFDFVLTFYSIFFLLPYLPVFSNNSLDSPSQLHKNTN